MIEHALAYATAGWEVFPLHGKSTAIPYPHPKGDPLRGTCKGECGKPGHGCYDGTTDVGQVADWWGGRYRECNIGVHVPASMFVLDVDDTRVLAELEAEHGSLPTTRTTISGKAAGGRHFWFWHPGIPIKTKVIIDALETKQRGGYLVMPPSIHPDSGNRYKLAVDGPVVAAPRWLIDLIAKPVKTAPVASRIAPHSLSSGGLVEFFGGSIADRFNAKTTWAEILMPMGWECKTADPESDGAKWAHPTATANWSASIKHGLLFVYSSRTPLNPTAQGDAAGYTKFKAFSVLRFPAASETESMSQAAKYLHRSRSI